MALLPALVGAVGFVASAHAADPSQWGEVVLAAGLLSFLISGVSFLFLGYMVIVKPVGTLVVQYRRADAFVATVRAAPESRSVKMCPMCAETVKT